MSNKKIFKNYVYNLVYQILAIILPIITIPYISRVLGADNIGIYGYTLSIVTYFTLLAALGITKYGQREIAYVQDDIDKRSRVFWELNIIRVITTSISLIVFYIMFCLDGEYVVYYKILILELLATLLDISWFFQGMENFKKVVIRNTVIKIMSVLSIFIFVKSQDDLIKYFCIYVFSNFFGNGILWFNVKLYVHKVKIEFKNLKKHVKPLISLFIPQIAVSIYTVLDKTMLGTLGGEMTEVAYYEQSQRIIKIALTVITTMSIVMMPRISNVYAQGKEEELNTYMKQSFKFDWFLGIPIMFGIMAIASNFVPWFFGEGFEKVVQLLIVGSPIIICIAFSTTIGSQLLISIKKQNIHTTIVITGAIINVILNLLLIPTMKSEGAIVSTVIAETVIFIIEILYVSKTGLIKLENIFDGMYKYLLSGIIMLICILFISKYLPIGIIYTMLQIVLGMIVYILCLLALKDEILINVIKKIYNKVFSKSK